MILKETPLQVIKGSSKSVLISRPSKSASMCVPSQTKSQWKITTKYQRFHKLVFEEGGLPDGTEVAYHARGQKLLEGYKMGFSIFCCCCNHEVSPSKFEAHAGWASRRKPWWESLLCNGCPRAFHKECACLTTIPRGDLYRTYCQNKF